MPAQIPKNDGANRPVHEIRHRRVRATIWRNETAKGPMYNVTISRSYRDEAGEWHDTGSFGYDELTIVAKLMYDAHSWITAVRAKESITSRPASAKQPIARDAK